MEHLLRGATRSCGCIQKEVTSLRSQGERNPAWKGGKKLEKGYVLVRNPKHNRSQSCGYVRENIVILEKKLGRSLFSNEIAHHKDGRKDNNHPDNLEAITVSEHAKLHNTGEKNHWAKLTESAVCDIRKQRDKPVKMLADNYGVTIAAIYSVWQGRTWQETECKS
jgi:hypothetical protein